MAADEETAAAESDKSHNSNMEDWNLDENNEAINAAIEAYTRDKAKLKDLKSKIKKKEKLISNLNEKIAEEKIFKTMYEKEKNKKEIEKAEKLLNTLISENTSEEKKLRKLVLEHERLSRILQINPYEELLTSATSQSATSQRGGKKKPLNTRKRKNKKNTRKRKNKKNTRKYKK